MADAISPPGSSGEHLLQPGFGEHQMGGPEQRIVDSLLESGLPHHVDPGNNVIINTSTDQGPHRGVVGTVERWPGEPPRISRLTYTWTDDNGTRTRVNIAPGADGQLERTVRETSSSGQVTNNPPDRITGGMGGNIDAVLADIERQAILPFQQAGSSPETPQDQPIQ